MRPHRLLPALSAALTLLVSSPATTAAQDRARALEYGADSLLRRGRAVEAAAKYLDAFRADSAEYGGGSDVSPLVSRAYALRLLRRDDAAIAAYRAAIAFIEWQGFTLFLDPAREARVQALRARRDSLADSLGMRVLLGGSERIRTPKAQRKPPATYGADSALVAHLDAVQDSLLREAGAPDDNRYNVNREPLAMLEVAMRELGAMLREHGQLDAAAKLLARADSVGKRVQVPLRTYMVTGEQDPDDHAHAEFSCAPGIAAAWCADTVGPIAPLRQAMLRARWYGMPAAEVRRGERLAEAYASVDAAAAAKVREELRWPSRVAGVAGVAAASAQPAAAVAARASVRRLKDAEAASWGKTRRAEAARVAAAGDVAGAIRQLLDEVFQLRQKPIGSDHGSFDVKAERLEAMAALAELYHRRLQPANLRAATAWYDSASHAGQELIGTEIPDAYRATLADRMGALHGEWALAWLGRWDANPDRPVMAAVDAIEEGRARVLQLMRSEVDFSTGAMGTRTATYSESDEVLIDYAIARDTLLTWAFRVPGTQVNVNTNGVHFVRRAIDPRTVRAGAAAFRAALEAGAFAPTEDQKRRGVRPARMPREVAQRVADSASVALYDLLLPREIIDSIPEGATLAIVPDPGLSEVPWAVLRRATADAPLASRVGLRFAPSVKVLHNVALRRPDGPKDCATEAELGKDGCGPSLDPWPADSAGRARVLAKVAALRRRWLAGSVVVGDPAMPSARRADTEARIDFEALPQARIESRDVASALGVLPLTGAAATESAVRQRLPKARVIHLATHGFAYGDPVNASRSFVALARDARNDGLLEARELIADTTLKLNADLVVLSACETARGASNQGEGTIGLQRAFLARGAASMLVSQWKVPDEATRLLMDEFYKGWLSPGMSLSKAQALRRAQAIVASRPEFAAPVNWAAFMLVGAP